MHGETMKFVSNSFVVLMLVQYCNHSIVWSRLCTFWL